MFLHLPVSAWVAVAAVVTVGHVAVMRWCMPTRKGKRSVSFIPLVLGVAMVGSSGTKGVSFPAALYLYSAVLLLLVVMIAPVRKSVAADILRQEQNPDVKVELNGVAMTWITVSLLAGLLAVVGVWASQI
ncbi:hypothetical protein [Streptomyces hoynatensis]|uniref:Uncharacterized protein n=1 Tax=Streptomyces hoynatensis TaxID=1141874 RepID=A0A3A9YLQ4_9ACTN|nr:hypothetical protein [Streptomyces hoynatensis]RKN37190.1 hypothetical protein D7294_28650 [Streptomyces hoynatensis]